ncbi:MAG: YfiT family bacillithiol transferase [Terriglobales bacterium]
MSPDPRYPVGRFQAPPSVTASDRAAHIATLAAMPAELRALVEPLAPADLDRRYREGGWTVRQLVHHLADSHMNAYIRMKFVLAEDAPTVKVYDEAVWAELPDVAAPVGASLVLLEGLHQRWVVLLRALPEAAFQRTMNHPEWGLVPLDQTLALYSWHARHHTAHIRLALA